MSLRRDRGRDQLLVLATVAHELRNTLGPIRNALFMIKENLLEPHTVLEASELIERQVNNIELQINDLGDYAQITAGKMSLHQTEFQLVPFLAGLLSQMRNEFKAKNLRVDFAPAVSARVFADQSRLEQVFVNLLNNACRYGRHNLSLSVTLEEWDKGPMVAVSVGNDGESIPPALLPLLFEPFVGEDHGRGGLGIGLYLAKNILSLHHGSIVAQNREIGAEFVVRLPVEQSPPDPK